MYNLHGLTRALKGLHDKGAALQYSGCIRLRVNGDATFISYAGENTEECDSQETCWKRRRRETQSHAKATATGIASLTRALEELLELDGDAAITASGNLYCTLGRENLLLEYTSIAHRELILRC